MNEPDILYAAIFIFIMMVIGLALTVLEFKRVQSAARPEDRKGRTGNGLKSGATSGRIPGASGIQ